MKYFLKILGVIVITLLGMFLIYIIEEGIRLRVSDGSLPFIVTSQTKYCISCMNIGEELEVDYWSIGYKLEVRYTLSSESTADNKIIRVVGEEFLLFNNIRLWAWIS